MLLKIMDGELLFAIQTCNISFVIFAFFCEAQTLNGFVFVTRFSYVKSWIGFRSFFFLILCLGFFSFEMIFGYIISSHVLIRI